MLIKGPSASKGVETVVVLFNLIKCQKKSFFFQTFLNKISNSVYTRFIMLFERDERNNNYSSSQISIFKFRQ